MKRTTWYVIIGGTLLASIGFTSLSIHSARQSEKEQAMISELNQLRTAIMLYKTTFHENPTSLATAMDAKYSVATPQWSMERDTNGTPLDPFQNHYKFDSQKGWVSSATTGYESW